MRQFWGRLSDVILAAQPLGALGIYLTFFTGNPPLWLSWCLALIPFPLRLWRRGQLVRRTPFDIPILIFIAGIIVGFLVSPDKEVSWQTLHTYLASILIYYGIVSNSKAKATYWLTLAGIACLLVLGITIYTFSQGEGRYFFFNEWVYELATLIPKIQGPQPSYNTAGAALALVLPVLLAVTLFQQRPRLRLWAAVICLVFLALLFLIGSGGGWLSAAIGLIFVLLCWKLWGLALALPAMGFGSWVIVSSWDKASPLAQTWVTKMFPFSSIISRVNLWEYTIDLLRDHPFVGIGLGAWFESYLAHSGQPVINAHNTYLQLYADAGLLGGIAIIYAAVVFVYVCWHILHSSSKSNWYGPAVGTIGCILAGTFNAIIEVNTSAYVLKDGVVLHYVAVPALWILAAMLVVALNHLQDSISGEASPRKVRFASPRFLTP